MADMVGEPTPVGGEAAIDEASLEDLVFRLAETQRALLETQRVARIGSWVWHVVSDRLEWSSEMYRIFGLEEATFTGSLADVMARSIHPDDRAAVEGANRAVAAEGRAIPLRYRIIRPDGTVRTVWAEAGSMVRDRDGRGVRLSGIVQDITDQAAAEEALRDSERRWMFAVEGSHEGLWDWDLVTDRVFYSTRWKEMLGLEHEDLAPENESWRSRVHPDDLEEAEAVFSEHLAGRTPAYASEHRMRHRDGHWVWILARGMVAARDEQGRPLRVIGTHSDITERVEAAASLRASEERYRHLVERAPGIVYGFGMGHGGTYYSPRVEEILGYSPERLLAEPYLWHDSIHPEDRPRVQAAIADAQVGRQFTTEYRIRGADGAEHWFEDRSVRHIREGGEMVIEGTALDVTDRHRAEADRDQLRVQLEHAQRMESLGRLAGGVAHDFNNMLGAILGHVDLALEVAPAMGTLREDLHEIRSAAIRSADLTRQLLAFARRQPVKPTVVDVNARISGMLGMIRRMIGEEIAVDFQPDPSIGPVLADASQLDQVITNLCINARDAIAAVGRVTISTGPVDDQGEDLPADRPAPSGWIRISVADDGSGIEPGILNRIFEPFFTTKDVGAGTGLGLAIVHGIASQHGGTVRAQSVVGQGSRFDVILPVHVVTADAAVTPVAATPDGGTETLLLVEDEPALLRMGTRLLERLGYHVLPAASPEEALALAQSHHGRIDLLVSDIVMPHMSGPELAVRLGTIRPGLRRLFVSGYPADAIARHGMADASEVIVPKPYSLDELAGAVRAVLGAPVRI